jgi:protein-tyrosine phosphatase
MRPCMGRRSNNDDRETMIDIHCHILPNVDDGPKSLDESFEMARFCVADGITHIVATPHCHRFIHLLRAEILPNVAELNHQLDEAGIPLTILPGSEIQVTDSAAYREEFEAGLFCHLGDRGEFTLLEFNWSAEQFPPDAAELIAWIRARGTTPILAHPERFEFFRKDVAKLHPLVEAGAWIQITVDSLLGNHGTGPQALGEALLRTYPEAVLATDAHNMHRCSGMAAGYAWVREHLSEARATDLLERAERLQASLLAAV